MKRTIDLDQVRVVQADNYKGNSRVYLEIMDERVLYSDPWAMLDNDPEYMGTYVTSEVHGTHAENTVDTESLTELFRFRLGRILARLLLEDDPSLAKAWSTKTDREIDYVKPRLEEDRDY